MPNESVLTGAEWDAWRSFSSMRRRLDRALEFELQHGCDVSLSEFEILLALSRAPDQQLRIKDIAQRIDWEKSRVSHQVTRLERRRLLVRSICETDARGWWVTLTPAGVQAVSRAVGAHQNAVRRYFFDVLQEGEELRINELSTRVVDAIDALRPSA
ncbi:MarR family winged helix-turn-helix transcriptional regulator [Parafrigoribacterium mesophilum]|uniref:MarR family winged helix-turn-helix transcriptional regulator n=1 Tax=Parafrigoribacterium mesophilum TaxID=433646 RepID=UPI0031FE1DBD